MTIYYVYAYLREDSTPYYIGKGKNDRAYSKKHNCPVPKDRNRIIILEQNLEEQAALDLEAELIKRYGRKDLGTGILHNKTDGGRSPVLYGTQNGMTGLAHKKETRDRIRKSKQGKPRSNDVKHTCPICDKTFAAQGYVKHCDRAHPQLDLLSEIRPFKCDHCGNGFASGSSLRAHIHRMHPGMSTVGVLKKPRCST